MYTCGYFFFIIIRIKLHVYKKCTRILQDAEYRWDHCSLLWEKIFVWGAFFPSVRHPPVRTLAAAVYTCTYDEHEHTYNITGFLEFTYVFLTLLFRYIFFTPGSLSPYRLSTSFIFTSLFARPVAIVGYTYCAPGSSYESIRLRRSYYER